jgi:hypothetical protein
MIMLIKTLAAVAAGTVLATNAFDQSTGYEVITSASLARSPPPKIAPPGGGLVSGKRRAETSFVRPPIS